MAQRLPFSAWLAQRKQDPATPRLALPAGQPSKTTPTLPVPVSPPARPLVAPQPSGLVARPRPLLPVFDDQTGQGYGTVVPRVDTTPRAVEMFFLAAACSASWQRFVMVYGKTAIGLPYRLLYNVTPEEVHAVMQEAAAQGIHLHEPHQGTIDWQDFDWSNWQCLSCGRGKIHGDQDTWWWCRFCSTVNCAAANITPRNAAKTGYCVPCRKVYPLGGQVTTLSGVKQLLARQR